MKVSDDEKSGLKICETGVKTRVRFREQLPQVAENIVGSCYDAECFEHIDAELIPSRESVIEIIKRLRQILFPGYFSRARIDPVNVGYQIGQSVDVLFELLSEQITHSIRHECRRYDQPCIQCAERGYKEAIALLESIPGMRKVLATDIRAAYEGDPAAKSYDEIVFSYPGIFAITVHRIAHQLFDREIPLLPRIMSEYAHSVTGIDIHPGAQIGASFFVDHGTGVVIGETAVIGRNVRIYQGVTLGALSLPKDAVERLRGKRRHPTVEDDVIIYAGATILGEKAVIGAHCVIGGNVWITEAVPPGTKVILEAPKLVYK